MSGKTPRSNLVKGQNIKRRKRSKIQIINQVLRALIDENETHSKPSLTRVADNVKIPYDRLKIIVANLSELELCKITQKGFNVTEKGIEFLHEYDRFNKCLLRIGIQE